MRCSLTLHVLREDSTEASRSEAEAIMEMEEGTADYASWTVLYDLGLASRESLIRRYSSIQNDMMGTAPGFVPGILDRALIDEIVLVSEAEAFSTCRELARTEGILVGISSGASVCAALRLAQDPSLSDKVIVCMLCDSGERYLSV